MDLLALLSRRLLVPPQDRGGYGQELAKLAFELLERRDRVLAGYVREDLQPICRMFPAGSGSRKTPNWTAHSATAGQSIWAFLKELDDTTLGLLISSARYLRGWPDPIQRLPAPSREGLQAVLADIPVAPAIDAALAGAVRRIWPDVGKVRVLGRITDPEVAALNEAFTPPPNVPEGIAVVAHLETEPDPLLAFKTLDPGARRLVVSYRPPPTYVPGLDIPSAGDLASTGAAAGWQIERFETLVGRTCLFLSR